MRDALEQYRYPDRREFLRVSGIITGLLWSSSTALLALAPAPAWALSLQALEEPIGRGLLTLTRRIFPHATLDDAVYALVVQALDTAAAGDPAIKILLTTGMQALQRAAAGDWQALPEARQLELVAAIAGSPFFEKVRSTAVVALYNNELAFAHFGYEGNAFTHGGGYLQRGFNDLTWLPAPPPDASPPPS